MGEIMKKYGVKYRTIVDENMDIIKKLEKFIPQFIKSFLVKSYP